MKIKILHIISALVLSLSTFSQNSFLELTFTAIDSVHYIQLDSIKIMNRSKGCDTILFWPDSVLMLDLQTGYTELNIERSGFQVYQNYPNPAKGLTHITLFVPSKDNIHVVISDILGRQVLSTEKVLDKGCHSFKFTPGAGNIYFFTAYWQGNNRSIKIINGSSATNQASSLKYSGKEKAKPQFKSMNKEGFEFQIGDSLLYIGYVDNLHSGILDTPDSNQTYIFQLAFNIPCIESPNVIYGGQEYYTVQIFNQCWLKENLNVGTMIPGDLTMTNNAVVEKYCYKNNDAYCDEYGGLYQWNEMMQYTAKEGAQGICPPGWHIPTDEDWKILEGAVDSKYGIGDPEWDGWGFRGFDNAHQLKSKNGWSYNYNGIDSHGFSALPGGLRYLDGNFYHAGVHMNFWSCNKNTSSYAWNRMAFGYLDEVYRVSSKHIYGYSVRCIKD